MLSDEEKKAIDYLQLCYDLSTITNESLSKLGIVLNLIEKQSKEIEELKEENKEIREWKYVIDNPIDLKKLSELDIIKIFGKSYIAKDKIKAKIEEIEEEKRHYLEINDEYNAQICDCIIEKYKSLLEKE